jgi:hypothetical protein
MNIKAIFISAKRIFIICAIAALAIALGGKTSDRYDRLFAPI